MPFSPLFFALSAKMVVYLEEGAGEKKPEKERGSPGKRGLPALFRNKEESCVC